MASLGTSIKNIQDNLYSDNENIQNPVKDLSSKPRLGAPIKTISLEDKEPVENKKPHIGQPVKNIFEEDLIPESEKDYPEITKARQAGDLSKSQSILDNELEKLNEVRKNIIKSTAPITSPQDLLFGAKMTEVVAAKQKEQLAIVDKKIAGLRSERMDISRKINPVSDNERKDIEDSFNFNVTSDNRLNTGTIKSIMKYGQGKVDRVENELLSKTYDDYEKSLVSKAEKDKNPAGMFTWSAIKYADRGNLKQNEISEIQAIYKLAEEKPEFYGKGMSGTFDYKSKIKVLQSTLSDYIDKKYPDITPEAKEAKIMSYSKYLGPSLAFGNENRGSVEGLKMFAADFSIKLDDRLSEITQVRDKLHNMEFGRKEGQPVPWNTKEEYEEFQSYKERIERKYKLLQNMVLFNKTIMKTPEQKRGIRDLGKGITNYNNLQDVITLGISEMQRTLNVAQVAKKVERNEELSWEEQAIMEQYSVLQSMQAMGTQGTWAEVGAGITNMLPYMATFALSGGIFNTVESVTKKGISTVAKKTISSTARKSLNSALTYNLPNFSKAARILNKRVFSLPEMANKLVGFTAGSAAQTLALPQYYVKNIAERTIPNMSSELNKDLTGLVTMLDKNTGEQLGSAIWKGGMDAFWEISTERLGKDLLRLSKLPGRAIKSYTGRNISKEILATQYMKLKGFKSVGEAVSNVTQKTLGWHDIKEEYLEELANQLGSMATSGDVPTLKDFLHNQITTFLTVATFGGGMSMVTEGIKLARYGAVGDNVLYYSQKKGEKKEKIYIPNLVHDKLLKIFNTYDHIDENGLANLLTEYSTQTNPDNNLTTKQINLILNLALQEGERKHERNLVIKALKRSGVPLSDVLEDEASEKVEPVELSEDDIDKITTTNLTMKEKHPELFSSDLLERDNTGQLLEPTIEYLSTLRDQVQSDIDKLSEKNEDGTFVKQDDQALKEKKKEISILKNNLSKNSKDISALEALDKAQAEYEILQRTLPYEVSVLQSNILDIEKELDLLVEKEDTGFDYELPSEKNKILMDDLRSGKSLSGKIDLESKVKMLVSLDDGRQVYAYIGPQEGVNESPEEYKQRMTRAIKAWQNKESITLKLIPKADWNADDKAVEKFRDLRGVVHDLPYGDKIDVQVDGKSIAAIQIHDYNEKQLLDAKYKKAKELFNTRMGELALKLASKTGGVKTFTSLNDGEKVDFLKDIVNSLVTMLDVKVTRAIAWVKKIISESALTDKDKNDLNALVDLNESVIMRHVQSARLVQQGKAKKVVPLNIETLVFENPESVVLSGADKINSNLKSFSPLWKSISEEHNLSRDAVERAFYHISKLNIDNVRNEETYKAFLIASRSGDTATDAVLVRLMSIPFATAVSIFNFYTNTKITKQYGIYIDKRGVSVKLLNPAESYADFISNFNKNIGVLGIGTIISKIKEHRRESEKDFAEYSTLNPKQRYLLKKNQFEKDLLLLSEVTNISIDIWRNYFTEQTRETYQLSEPQRGTEKNFGTMDELFKNESYRVGSDGKAYNYRQSNLVFNLLYTLPSSINKLIIGTDTKQGLSQEEAQLKAFTTFFTKGKGKSLSNLYKLTTSLRDNDDIGLSGKDIKDDLFSSFIQYSDITNTAENILSSNVSNPLVNYYKTKGKTIDLVQLNGLHNLEKNRAKKGTSAINMSMEDLWVSFLSLYKDGTDTYLHSIGQFSDKPTIYLMEVPKVTNPTAAQIKELDKLFGIKSFNEAVDYLYDNIIIFNQNIFKDNQETKDMLRSFVYNYAINSFHSNQIFFGEQTKESYPNGILSLVKRAGSSNSPGYRLNRFIEGGVGESFRFATANEHNIPGITKEGLDGIIFMSGGIAGRIQTSMGTIYSKLNEYPTLSSVKAVMSLKDKATNKRGLTKANIVNIDSLQEIGSDILKDIKEYMKKNRIDILSFTSSSKITEKGEVISLFNSDGSFNKSAEAIDGTHIINRDTQDLYVQQDLRHSLDPKTTKMPTPFLANMLALNNGHAIAGLISEMQTIEIRKLEKSLDQDEVDNAKRKWLLENVNDKSQPDLKRLLDAGLTIDDATYRKMMQVILSSAISRRALEIPINRVTSQEIPDIGGLLQSAKKTANGKHVLLPEIMTGVTGAREHNHEFKGKSKEAIEHVKENKDIYIDLFDLAGNLMEWEITERDGVIPGEIIISTRVPAHGPTSHTVARLAKNLTSGNFTMLDRKSQIASGSDFDGDQRYNQVFYRRKGNIVLDTSQKGIANRIIMLVAEDYADPIYFDRINLPIDMHAYDKTVDRLREGHEVFKSIDPRAYEESRLNNIVGVLMKGILTEHNTIVSIISRYNMFFKTKRMITYDSPDVETEGSFITNNIRLDNIAKDDYGAIKAHIGNLQNLAFDNAKDPKIEIIGLNEITANMFTLALIGDNRNSSRNYKSFQEHYEAIKESIDRQADYFTSDLLKSFIRYSRRNNGGMRNEETRIIFNKLISEANSGNYNYTVEDVKNLQILYYSSNELSDFGALYSLTKEAPRSYSDFLFAQNLVEKVKANKMKIFDTKSLFRYENGNAEWVTELGVIDKLMDLSRDYIYEDTIEETPVGRRVMNYVLMKMTAIDEKKKTLSKAEIDSLSNALNSVFNILALKDNRTASQVETELNSIFPKLKLENTGNEFFNFIDIVERTITVKGREQTLKTLQVIPEFTIGRVPEKLLEGIREGFSKLPDHIKDLFAIYTLSRFGASSVTSNGGFYSFFDDNYRVELSKKASIEMNDWIYDELSPLTQLNIADWVIKANRNEAIKKLADTPSISRVVDVNQEPTLPIALHRDSVEGMQDVNDVEQYLAWEKQYNVGPQFRAWIRSQAALPSNKKMSFSSDVKPFFESFRSRQLAIANKYFPQSEQENEIRDYHTSAVGHVMMTNDPNLQKFIYDRLSKMFPGVRIFTDREAFYAFARKNSANMQNVNPEAIGHAFKNAIFIDATSAIQDKLFHEYAHIYWDALPSNNKSKEELRKLYSDQYNKDEYTQDEIDEMIVIDIGRAGTDLGNTFLTGSRYDKFLEHVKAFWRSVKELLGMYSKTDLVNDMAWSIWNNKNNIKPTTAQGEAEIKNMIEYDHSEKAINRDKQSNSCKIGGKHIIGVNSMIKRKESIKFDADEMLSERLKRFEAKYKEDTGKNPTPEILFEESQQIELEWSDKTKAGSAIHAVAEEVFSGKKSTDKEVDKFANNSVREQLRISLNKLKKEILQKYPHAKFITEMDLISVKYNVFGLADLVVDLGDNKILIFDFKTTSVNYLNPDKTKSDYYLRSYGLMKFPLNKLHQTKYASNVLQLSTYAEIAEEQENTNNPGEKNIVEGLYVVPILRHLDDNGNIIFAEISGVVVPPIEEDIDQDPIIFDNLIKINYEKGYVEGLLKDHAAREKGFSAQYVAFNDQLSQSGLPKAIQQEILAGYSYISNISNGDLSQFKYSDLEEMQNNSLTEIVGLLVELEYTRDDMATMPFEVMINIAKNGIKKSRWEKEASTLYTQQVVGSNIVKKLNPKRSQNTWYHKSFEFENHARDHYFYEAGTASLAIGDQVIRIMTTKGVRKTYEDYNYYKVLKINKKAKWVEIENQESGTIERITGVEAKEGILKVYDGVPLAERGVIKNNYIPRFIEEEEELLEYHWNYPFSRTHSESTAEGIAEERSHLHAQRLLWKWFNEYNTIREVRTFIDDQQNVADIYHSIASLDARVAFNLMDFMRDTALNHYQATQIRIEHANGPSTMMPMTMNTYYMLTKPEKVFMDFQGVFRSARWLMPARMLEARNSPINFVLMGLDNALRRVGEEQFELNTKMRKLFNKVDINNVVRSLRGQKFWRTPNMQEFKEEEIIKIKDKEKRERKRSERLLLELIYEHYYKFDPKYIALKKLHKDSSGYPRQIPVSKMFSTKQELVETPGIGRKWASILHELMQPGMYDNIKLETDILDAKGNKKIMKFSDIKELFALENASKEEREEWMGSRIRHMFTGIPVLRNFISAGKLYNYYKKARQIYLRGDKNNIMAVDKGRRVTTLGGRDVRYQTKYLLEAETKVMESNIFAYFMKRMAAPIDYVRSKYSDNTQAGKYLTELTDFLVYKKSSELGTEFTALVDFMTRVTSLSRIAWSPKTNVMNFAIGQTMDLVREPGAWALGIKRIATNWKKSFAILRRYELANIVDEARFDELAKAAGLKVKLGSKESILSYENTIDLGYIFMEMAEKGNQAPIFIGLMTDKEFASYDDTGAIIDKTNALTMNRKIMLADRVKDIHGDYGPKNAAPFWNTNWGKLLAQFKKYYPSTLFAQFASYHIDRQYMIRSGIVQTVSMFIRAAKFNMSGDDIRMKRITNAQRIIAEKIKEGNMDEIFIKNTKDYLNMLLAAKDEGRLQWKEFSSSDKRNLVSAIIQMTLMLSTAIAIHAIKGGADDKGFVDADKRWWWQFLNRYQGDIFFYANSQTVSNQFKAPFAMVSTAQAMVQGTVELTEWMYYAAKDKTWYPEEAVQKKDTPYLKEGEPKFIRSFTGFIPAGGMASWLLQQRMNYYNNQEFLTWLEKQGFNPNIIKGAKDYVKDNVSRQEVKDGSREYDAIINALGKAMLPTEQLELFGIIDQYSKDVKQQLTDLEKYIVLQQLKTLITEGNLPELEEIYEKATQAQKVLDKDKHAPLKNKQKRFDKQLELLNNK